MATSLPPAPPASTNLPPTLTMNSSHSSEGSSITSFVVVDESSLDEQSQISIKSEDAKEDIIAKSENSTEGGSAADQHELVERVQNLAKENEELKGLLLHNNNLLEGYFKDLASMQKNQKHTNESLRKGYDQAKEVVKKLREKNSCLKNELKNEQNKNLQLEEQMAKLKDTKLNKSFAESDNEVSKLSHNDQDDKPNQVQSLEEEIKRLESENVTLQTSNSKLQEHIECLRVMRESDTSIEADEFGTLVSEDSLPTSPSDQVSVEVIQEKYSKLETEKEILVVDLEKIKIESEQKQQQYQKMEDDYNNLVKKLADMEQTQASEEAGRDLEQITELSQQLEIQTGVLTRLKEELESEKLENERYKQKIEELQQTKESSNTEQAVKAAEQTAQPSHEGNEGAELKEQLINMTHERDTYKKKLEEFQTHLEEAKACAEEAFGVVEDTEIREKYAKLSHQLNMYQNQEKEIQAREKAILEKEEMYRQENALFKSYQEKDKAELEEAVNKMAASQEECEKKSSELRAQQRDNEELKKQLEKLAQERDLFKMKAEESQVKTVEEGKQTCADGDLGAEGGDDLKEKFKRVKSQLWNYQKRESDILNKENAVLEKEEAYKKLLKHKEQLQKQLADAVVKTEALEQEKQKQEEDAQLLNRQLSETHENEMLLLKEELQTKNTEVVTAKTCEDQLSAKIAQLVQEKQNLATECEMQKTELARREQETESLKKELSETHEQEVLVLKEEINSKNEAISLAQTSEEHLKAQVTQLIQENEALKMDLEQQENMYQDHLHKITQDSENQRQRRDEIIKNLQTKLSNSEGELQKTRAKHAADENEFLKLQHEHRRIVAEYRELQDNYHITLDNNKEQVRAAQTQIDNLTGQLREEDDHVQKLKEDIRIREEELGELRERNFHLHKLQEQFPILEHQLSVYSADFQVEREAREKQHEEILRLRDHIEQLQRENQRFQDEMERLGHAQMEEMQRRHGSFVPGPQDPQQPRGWFDGFTGILFPRGGVDMPENQRNPEVHMQPGEQTPGRGQVGGQSPVHSPGGGQEEDWTCPTCRRNFPNFDNLQIHAVECGGPQAPATEVANQCPKCMKTFPDFDTLAIHVEECLDQE